MRQDLDKRILLIDGDLAVHARFGGILCALGQEEGSDPSGLPSILRGIELDAVRRGKEGLALAREALQQGRPYLLAVVDLQGVDLRGTGDPDGPETVRRLWSQDPALGVLICTAGDHGEISRQLGQDQRLSFLSSPPDPREVRQLVGALVDCSLARRRSQDLSGELDSTRRELERTREEAKAASRAKSEFMANVSHEIRTPMNAILGFTRLLLKEPLDADQLQKLHFVHDAGESLLSLIDNLLDYSMLSAGELELSASGFSLDALIRDVLEETRASAKEKQLAVGYHIVEAVPRWLQGDRRRFRQILVNLIGNAIKFTDCGTIHVQIMLDEQAQQTATLRVVVTDTGVGIPVEGQTVIFESFSQADGSATRQFEGVGLGLSICKQLVDLMGGQVGFRSDSGQGARFWLTVTFPKHRPSHREVLAEQKAAGLSAVTPRPHCAVPAGARPAKPHVLVAEEGQLDRTLAEMLLTRAGCLVDLAGSGSEAAAMLEKTSYDLLLMDTEMLQTVGPEAIGHLRQQETTGSRRFPIVVPTAYGEPAQRQQYPGAEECIPKPYAPETLIGTVRRLLSDYFDRSESETASGQPPGASAQPPGASAQPPGAGGPSDRPQTAEDYLRCLHEALERENFREIETFAGALKRILPEVGFNSAADQAMRVQLAARSDDLKRAAAAIPRLRAALQDGQASAMEVKTSFTTNPSRGGS